MTLERKKEFIRELTDSVRDSLIARVDRMPARWSGLELRKWIADDFAGQCTQFGEVYLKSIRQEILELDV